METGPADRAVFYRRWFWIFVAGFTLFRLLAAGRFGYSTDESHYVLYARELAWGYFDHPPMVAFLAAFTSLFRETVFTARLGPILLWTAAVILLRRLALWLYNDEGVAFWAVIILALMPIQHLLAIALLPDAPLNLFWCATLVVFWHAMKHGRWGSWVLAGLFFGAALLSKYHGILLPPVLFAYLLASRENRRWLKTPQPYVAVLAGLLVFSPNIIWNWRHDWLSYAYQVGHGVGGGGLRPEGLAEVIGGQLGAASPVIFGLLVAAWVVLIKERFLTEADRFVFWTSLPVFAFFGMAGIFGKTLPHWPIVGWWTGSLAIASVGLRKIAAGGRSAVRWRRWAIGGAAVALSLIVFMYAAIACPIVEPAYNFGRRLSVGLNRRLPFIPPLEPYELKFDVTNDLYGWEEAAAWVEEVKAAMPDPDRTFVFGHRFYTISQLKVYLDPDTVGTSLQSRPNQYSRIWFDAADHRRWDALFIDDNHYPQGGGRYRSRFERGDPNPIARKILRGGKVSHDLKIYRYYGFKG